VTLKKTSQPELPVKLFKTVSAWEAWLARNGALAKGLWLRIAKKGASLKSLSYDEALEVALCYGWIDGQKKALDEVSWVQRFSPRGARSIWSKINCAKAERLITEGRMQPTGLAAVEKAKENGQWERAYAGQRSAAPIEDFEAFLLKNVKAKAFYETLNAQNRYAIHFRIQGAKKPETRLRRIEKFIEMLERHEKLHP
jgi:uncharacterized protein YdeI (YjbR/CyaY-like superfamily)